MISLRDWASAMERVLKLGLPWRVLRSQLVGDTQQGMMDYRQWMREFSITEPKLEVRRLCVFLHKVNKKKKSQTNVSFPMSRCQITVSWRPCTETTPTWRPSSESSTQITQVSEQLSLEPSPSLISELTDVLETYIIAFKQLQFC